MMANKTGVRQYVETLVREGRWEFRRIDERGSVKDGFGYVSDDAGRDILHVGERTLSEDANVAIGHLAAAAPDLYAAVEAQHQALDTLLATLIEHVPTFVPTRSPAWPAIEAGHAALRKARGES